MTGMEPSRVETLKVEGNQLIGQIKRLMHEGNVRRVVIRQGEQTIVEFPLTVGVIGTLLVPTLAAVGAVAALVSECTIEVERTDTPETNGTEANVLVASPAVPVGSNGTTL